MYMHVIDVCAYTGCAGYLGGVTQNKLTSADISCGYVSLWGASLARCSFIN